MYCDVRDWWAFVNPRVVIMLLKSSADVSLFVDLRCCHSFSFNCSFFQYAFAAVIIVLVVV